MVARYKRDVGIYLCLNHDGATSVAATAAREPSDDHVSPSYSPQAFAVTQGAPPRYAAALASAAAAFALPRTRRRGKIRRKLSKLRRDPVTSVLDSRIVKRLRKR